MKRTVFVWIPYVFLLSIFSLVIYVTLQQNLRMASNDPQIQLAEDTASYLVATDADPKTLVGTTVDLNQSLATFGVVYDDKGAVLASGALLDGKPPIPPAGVFEYLKTHPEDRFTWEPKEGIRIAVVMKSSGGGDKPLKFVLIGRSLREIEKRINTLGLIILASWVGSLILTFIYCFFTTREKKHAHE